MSWVRWWRLVFPLLGLAELGLHCWQRQRAPDLAQWRTLSETVRQVLRPGGLVVVSPPWAEPLARSAFGSELMPLAHVARPDEQTFESALEVSILGEEAQLAGFTPGESQRLGAFRLRHWTNSKPRQVLFDFVERLGPEGVQVTSRRRAAHSCEFRAATVSNGDLHGHPTFPRKRFVCGGGDWHFVGVTVIEDQQYKPRRCIWAHPTGKKPLSIRFASVPFGGRVVGYAGLPYFFEREKKGAVVQLELVAESGSLGRWEHADGEGWKRFEFDLPKAQTAGWLEFQVTTARAYRREFCFSAQVRK